MLEVALETDQLATDQLDPAVQILETTELLTLEQAVAVQDPQAEDPAAPEG
jgi:hypothetical protein